VAHAVKARVSSQPWDTRAQQRTFLGQTPLRRATVQCSVASSPPSAQDTKPLNALLTRDEKVKQKLVFVGGKGGVGKTSTSSAIATRCADAGFSTLIVSTDPAHSLSDALMLDVSGGKPVEVSGLANLDAMEVDTADAVARFREAVGGFRAADLGLGGIAEEVVSQLGLDEFADILDNTPPGLDELLALSEVLALVRENGKDGNASYERVIFDTAPTGHTLRLLAFPEFLEKLLSKLIALKGRLSKALGLLKGLLGPNLDPAAKLERAVEKIQTWRDRVGALQALLTNEDVTEFIVVGIASRLAVAECARLLSALVEQDIPVRHMVVNQLLTSTAKEGYMNRVYQEQQRAMKALDSGSSPLSSLSLSRVPFYDMEMRGIYALRYLGTMAYRGDNAERWRDLFDDKRERFVLLGGKGGVGKTTSSAALAIALAEEGLNTLIVSTDPAHSLGDALDVELSSGEPVRVEGVPSASLYAVEIKVDEALDEFRTLLSGVVSGPGGGSLDLSDFADVLDTVPPGVDELIALAKVVAFAREDSLGVHFDRVIIDTAPTGHTLRLLTFPDFLVRFIDRVLALRTRFNSATSVLGGASELLGRVFGSDRKPKAAPPTEGEPKAVRALKKFRGQMQQLQDLLHDEKESEFAIVSIPTALSLSESERLYESLRAQNIAVRRGVLNRLIGADTDDAYLGRLSRGQQQCLGELRELAIRSEVSLTEVPFFDVEVRSVYGLRALGGALFDAPAE